MIEEPTLSVFVDESGRFQHPDKESPYYIISLVMHDQRVQIDGLIAELDRHFAEMRLSNVCFHAGPIIRQQNAFAIMDWTFRVKIFRFQNYAFRPQLRLLFFALPRGKSIARHRGGFTRLSAEHREFYQNRRAGIKRSTVQKILDLRSDLLSVIF